MMISDSAAASAEAMAVPEWRAPAQVPGPVRPATLWPWLTETGSPTARLRAQCREFQVRVLGCGDAALDADEQAWVGVAAAMVREVYLCCNGAPAVYARTVAPDKVTAQRLSALGEAPLGDWAFARTAARDGLQVARVEPPHVLYRRALAALDRHPAALWCRRSRLMVSGCRLSICECFLEGGPWR